MLVCLSAIIHILILNRRLTAIRWFVKQEGLDMKLVPRDLKADSPVLA